MHTYNAFNSTTNGTEHFLLRLLFFKSLCNVITSNNWVVNPFWIYKMGNWQISVKLGWKLKNVVIIDKKLKVYFGWPSKDRSQFYVERLAFCRCDPCLVRLSWFFPCMFLIPRLIVICIREYSFLTPYKMFKWRLPHFSQCKILIKASLWLNRKSNWKTNNMLWMENLMFYKTVFLYFFPYL